MIDISAHMFNCTIHVHGTCDNFRLGSHSGVFGMCSVAWIFVVQLSGVN